MADIYPTHHCFDDVLEFFGEALTPEQSLHAHAEYTIVHAVCVTPIGQRFAHAWVEQDKLVWQGGIVDGQRIFYCVPKGDVGFLIEREVRYTLPAALALNLTTRTYGPWNAEIARLCGAKGERGIVARRDGVTAGVLRPRGKP